MSVSFIFLMVTKIMTVPFFVPKLAAVFAPYTLIKGALFSCEADYKLSYPPEWEWVGSSLGKALRVCDISSVS